MNIKKISVWGLFLAIGGMFFGSVVAVPILSSAIDLNASTVQVSFSPEVGVTNPPQFSCFGNTTSPAIASFAGLGILTADLPNPAITLSGNCFQQAGDYTITIHLQDNAGNSVAKGPYTYRVKASGANSTHTIITKTNCTGKFANNIDECLLELQLRDSFDNPITQISSAVVSLTTASVPNDANTAVSFVEGLQMEGVPATTNPATLSSTDGNFSFSLKAIAPSVQTVGNFLSQLVDRVLSFGISVSTINNNGGLGSGSNNLSIDTDTGLSFWHLFALRPSGSDFIWAGNGTTGTITLDLKINDPTNGPALRTGKLFEENTNLEYTNEALPFDLLSSLNAPSISRDVATEATLGAGQTYDEPQQLLRLHTDIEYLINGQTVKYPAGGSGFDSELGGVNPTDVIGYNTSTGVVFVGADIEGGVIGHLDKMKMQPGTDTFNVSESTDALRDQITENVFRLSRGSSNIRTNGGNFDPNWFSTYDVVIVKVQNADVTFPVGGVVPTGKKTLIIKNGNFIVEGDMTYINKEDSFGVILINDAQNTPENGNIFVRSGVKTMVGSYYADGGLMTNDNATPTVANSTNEENLNFVQLLLTGTLFSQNTLGGSMIEPVDGGYYLPWGTTSVQADARQYDLHYVRRYRHDLYSANCVPGPVAGCDSNDSSFVIRIDRKSAVAPPPGFEATGSIVR